MVIALVGARLTCEEVCCGGVCQEMCGEDIFPYKCPDLANGLLSNQRGACMKQFLIAETELRLFFYYIKYYDFSTILSQLKVVLRRLPVFHAECYTVFGNS